ncbi:MAG TPA: GGDEF domain-containing protein [Firmicutes bacterium]|nr:GGDEF domain-containing protein [Bacillota bacterium]
MQAVRSPRLYTASVFLTAAAALGASIVFYDGIPWERWPELLVLLILNIYFHCFPATVGENRGYSLGSAVLFAVVALMGTTPAVILASVGGLADGYRGKKSWRRILFNVSQFALSAVAGTLVYRLFRGSPVPVYPRDIIAVIGAGLTYIITNILLVTAMVSIWAARSWRRQLASFGFKGFLMALGNGHIGFIFTLFAVRYGLGGLILFSLFLIQLSILLRIGAVVQDEREIRKELEQELVIDEMTQVYNFRYLNNWLASPRVESLAALFIDIDDFSKFNDLYGHAEGDRVLKLLAATITKSVRQNDRVIRYGGEEFVVLLPAMNSGSAKVVAERIQGELKSLPYADWQQPITVSIGIASSPEDTADKHQLMLMADQAMYAAKQAGKNTYRVWQPQKGPA